MKRSKTPDNHVTQSSPISAEKSAGGFAQSMQGLNNKWNELSGRDQMALIILALFLVLVLGGYGGYMMHKAANEQKQTYTTAVSEYFWLRDQAANIAPAQNGNEDIAPDQKVMQILTQLGVSNPQVLNSGEALQISFSHDNQSAASNALGAMVNAGLSIEQLTMQQNPEDKVIRVQATVSQ